jgi:outer membrane biosynthesis protein TonB
MKHHPNQSRVRGALAAIAAIAVAMAVPSSAGAQPAGQPNGPKPQSPPPQSAQPQPQPPQPVQIDRNGVLILIRSTLLALHHANQTGNYTVLRDLGAPGFQAANTAARLAEIFANLRAQNLDLSGVAVLEPQLTTLPQSDASGFMRMAGFFPSVPMQVNFELLFAPVEGRWRLFGIGLNLGQSSPTAPPAPEPPKPEAQKPADKPAPQAGAAPKPEPSRPAPRTAAPTPPPPQPARP